MTEPLTFLASIAPLQSALTIASDGGVRVKLDIPETEMAKIGRLAGLRGKVLKVTVRVVRQQRQEPEPEWGDSDESGSDLG